MSKFIYAFGASTLLRIIPLLASLKWKKVLAQIVSREKARDSCKFALFVALLSFVYKAVLCLARRLILRFSKSEQTLSQPDKVAAPLAGFFAGLTLCLDSPFRRQFIAAITMSRLLETSINLGESRETIPVVKDKELKLFVAANLVSMYLLGCESDMLNGSLKSFYTHWAQMTPNDKNLVDIWHRMRVDRTGW